jgi:hypothetical protein
VVPAVVAFDALGVQLVGGQRVEPDVVICATGFRPGLEPIVGHLNVLTDAGRPRCQGAELAADGLWFIGYLSRPSPIANIGRQSRRMAKLIG